MEAEGEGEAEGAPDGETVLEGRGDAEREREALAESDGEGEAMSDADKGVALGGAEAAPDCDAEPVLEEDWLGDREDMGVRESELDAAGADGRSCSAKASRSSARASILKDGKLCSKEEGCEEGKGLAMGL